MNELIMYLATVLLLSFIVSLPSALCMLISNYCFVENDCTCKKQVYKPQKGEIIIE